MKNLALIFLGCILLLAACNSENKNARIEIWLTDGPGDFEAVNIDIQGVEVHTAAQDENDENSGWKSLDVNKGVYDVLELTNGIETLLGAIELPPGKISQVRLKLGNNNSVQVGGEVFNLKTPSGQQSGLKIQVHQVLVEGITYKVLLDFDAARSIVQKGNGKYALKPVIRSITEAQDGAIRGIVDPASATPAIYAIIGEDTLGTAYADEAGKFIIRGLSGGNYTVGFSPNSDYLPTAKDNVSVSIGSVTDIGTVTIEEK